MEQKPFDESIFITYANTPLKNSPDGLYATLGQIEKYLAPLHLEIKDKVDRLVGINKLPYEKNIKELYESGRMSFQKKMEKEEERLKEMRREERFHKEVRKSYQISSSDGNFEQDLKREVKKDDEKVMEVLEGVYGSRLIGCDYHPKTNPLGCRWGQIRRAIFKTKDLKCYECDHEHFVYILDALIEGRGYLEIAGLKLLIDSYRPPQTTLTISQEENSRSEEIIRINNLNLSYGGMMSFPKIFYGAVTQSLLDFLLQNERHRLKRCMICSEFFIAARNSRRDICSDGCYNTYMRDYLKGYMRKKRDKDGPDFDPKYV